MTGEQLFLNELKDFINVGMNKNDLKTCINQRLKQIASVGENDVLHSVINCKAATHELKTWIPYYKAVVGGVKQFEVRKDDRKFKEGDILHLREWDNTLKEYTGRGTKRKIRYILKGGAFGVQKGYVIMGLCCL